MFRETVTRFLRTIRDDKLRKPREQSMARWRVAVIGRTGKGRIQAWARCRLAAVRQRRDCRRGRRG